MANQRKHCEPSIARVYSERVRGEDPIRSPPPISLDTCCVHIRYSKRYENTDHVLSARLRVVMRSKYGIDLPTDLWWVHKRAKICGVRFTSGESIRGVKRASEKMLRCGSVITLVKGGRSLYAWVHKFMSYDTIHLAHVRWLPVPEYPYDSPMIVVLKARGRIPDLSCTVDLTDIDPTQVAILHEGLDMFVMRFSGIDTMPAV